MTETEKRVPLYERLPEIYRIRDEEQQPPGQLKSYLALVEKVFDEVHKNIESLYHDLFIDTCDDWVVPYIGDLLGVSHLSKDAWASRADVADTISLRRRKGTLASIERLTYNLTKWGVHCVELRENMVWNQHLNHQRPDEGGVPPYSLPSVDRFTPVRGGTVTLRDPAMLSLLGTPFDPFAHVADAKPPAMGNIRYNLPNLAIFLWRLEDHQVRASKPYYRGTTEITTTDAPEDADKAARIVNFDIHPLGRPVRLFNTYQFEPDRQPPVVTQLDATPGPIPTARLTEGSAAGRPEKYISIDMYDPDNTNIVTRDFSNVGLQFHLPVNEATTVFAGSAWPDGGSSIWKIRGANLCGWEDRLTSPVRNREIVIDPVIGRLLIGVASDEEANALKDHLLVTYTYGAVGPVGAHPTSRIPPPELWDDKSIIVVSHFEDSSYSFKDAILEALTRPEPALIEIRDSLTHTLDLSDTDIDTTDIGILNEDGGPNLQLSQPLFIRAADGQRPIIQLKQPLRFRPAQAAKAGDLIVRLEGLYLTRYESDEPIEPTESTESSESFPLIAGAAVNRLEIINCTLDPGGFKQLDGIRAPSHTALQLREPYGFENPADENAFDQTPKIVIQYTITGPIRIDRGYRLVLAETIVDAGENAATKFAIAGSDDPVSTETGELVGGWGAATEVNGITVFGKMRVERISGRGGIWTNALEVLNNQVGCIKFSYFSGQGDRLPQSHACVKGTDARLRFVSDVFGEPGYGQLAYTTDFRIRERGPGDDAMGAFGFLMEAHKWRNLQIRYREFMTVGVRPLLIPVT
jgi:hypothetical protein